MIRLGFCLALICLLVFGAGSSAVADERLRVAVAANFATTLQALAARYEQETGTGFVISPASSGKHYAQIRQGAPFDLFLSADIARAALLEQEGMTVPGSRVTYAFGRLVLWSPRQDYVDRAGEILEKGDYRRLAMANPRVAPYGEAARQVLEGRGLWQNLQQDGRIVRGESVGHAYHFVRSGGAELGFVALAQLLADDVGGSWWEPPAEAHDPVEQQAVVLARSDRAAQAADFLDWLTGSETAAGVIRDAGYRPPGNGRGGDR